MSPYLHLIPAEKMMEDIKRVVDTDVVRVATAHDISEYKAHRISESVKDEGNLSLIRKVKMSQWLLTSSTRYIHANVAS